LQELIWWVLSEGFHGRDLISCIIAGFITAFILQDFWHDKLMVNIVKKG
jgi:hypothetical protein